MAYIGNTIIAIVFIYSFYGCSKAMKCYKCTSTDLPTLCGDPFTLNSTHSQYIVADCDNCLKSVFKRTNVIIRNCTQSDSRKVSIRSGCKTEKISGNDVITCACGGELCNGVGKDFSYLHTLSMLLTYLIYNSQ